MRWALLGVTASAGMPAAAACPCNELLLTGPSVLGEAVSPACNHSTPPPRGVLILDGNSDMEASVRDTAATTYDGTAIAVQCCTGSTCKRRTSGSNDDCIAGASASFQCTTYQEASARCGALG